MVSVLLLSPLTMTSSNLVFVVVVVAVQCLSIDQSALNTFPLKDERARLAVAAGPIAPVEQNHDHSLRQPESEEYDGKTRHSPPTGFSSELNC